jgi:gluconate 2-dehydrogenase gamma chain
MSRREALRIMALIPLAGSIGCSMQEIGVAALKVEELGGYPLEPQFFTPAEWQTVRALVDLIIPADEKSGSATEALVPEFMDFMLAEASEARQKTFRDGLVWLDAETQQRFAGAFSGATAAQRRAILDDIAWPARAPDSLQAGVTFFNAFRDMTAAGFFSSRIGFEDLEFRGNEFVVDWQGCPEPALRKLGVSYDLMEDNG